MDICLLSVGKINTGWIQEGISLFEKRISNYIKFSNIVIPDIKKSRTLSKDEMKEAEGKLILANINPSDFVALMDERGKDFTSRNFAEWVQRLMNTGKKRLLFVIGGPFGFSENVYKRADTFISLSKMTFTHEMARLILTEQLYRGLTILKGEPYHHD